MRGMERSVEAGRAGQTMGSSGSGAAAGAARFR
jgi:hypothetical protein